jgi:hypothetical protein
MSLSKPKVLVLSGESGRWTASDRKRDADVMNGVEAWVFAFDGDYIHSAEATVEDISRYDIVIANLNPEAEMIANVEKLSAARPKSVKWVTLMEGSGLDYIYPRPQVREIFDNSDLVNCINVHSLELLRRMTKTRVEYIGIPYPVDGIAKLAVPFDKRRREALITPFLLKRWNDFFVARELGIEYYGFEKTIRRTFKNVVTDFFKKGERDFEKTRFLKRAAKLFNDKSLEILPERGLREFLSYNAGALLWINLDERYTWGRYVLDAAALKIPVITTKSTGHGTDLFPETTLENEFQIEKAIDIGRRLLKDKDFYRHVAEFPVGKMEHLKPEKMAARLLHELTF